jgi:tol-pal system protein YbgF
MRKILPFALLIPLACTPPAAAQMSGSDVVVRLEQIEQQMRMLTGQIEQLQYRNQQLEQQLQRLQGGQAAPQQQGQAQPQPQPQTQSYPQQQAASGPSSMQPRALPPVASAAPVSNDPSPIRPLPPMGRRGDSFDPNANPSAPGAPRPLGALPAGQPSAPEAQIAAQEPVGARGGRDPGAPLDLTQGAPRGGDQMAAVAPPSGSPRDQYDLGAGYIQRKDYALAEQTFRQFLQRYPSDRLAADAQFWLGESQFQRQMYREAADSFLAISTKYETAAKAPDSLLRLGQSLAALGEKETACATFAEVGRKYPRAALNVRQGVEREQKRVKC